MHIKVSTSLLLTPSSFSSNAPPSTWLDLAPSLRVHVAHFEPLRFRTARSTPLNRRGAAQLANSIFEEMSSLLLSGPYGPVICA